MNKISDKNNIFIESPRDGDTYTTAADFGADIFFPNTTYHLGIWLGRAFCPSDFSWREGIAFGDILE